MSYKFLLFDLDHTLLDFEKSEDIALTLLLEEEQVADIQAFKDFYVPMNAQLWKDLEQKKVTKKELISTRFAILFEHFGQEADGDYLADRYQHFLSQQGHSFIGAENLLTTLAARRYHLYGATNGITKIQEGRLAASDIGHLFRHVFISEQAGTQKPDLAYYDWIASQIENFEHSRALIIGDSLTADIQGGNNAGIDTVWYNPERKENSGSAIPTYTVTNYQEILTLLQDDC